MPPHRLPFTPPTSSGHLRVEVNPLTLTFTGTCASLEKPFIDSYARNSLSAVRLTLLLSVVFYGVFGILDAIMVPEMKHAFWLIRFGLVCPSIAIVYILSFSNWFRIFMQQAIVGLILISGFGIIYMTVMGNELTARTYYAGIILILMMAYTFIRARFIWATPACLILIAVYLSTALGEPLLPAAILANNFFFCVTANIIGMLVCYSMEYYARRDFYMGGLLDEERRKVETAKLALEQKVQRRTAMLAQANKDLRREIQAHQRLDWEKKALEDQLRQAQKMEAVGTLAGGIAHDFNNILAAVMGHTELAIIQRTNTKRAENYLLEVLKACERAKDLVGQILSFSRHGESELKPIQINTVVKEVLRLLRATLPSSITIHKYIQPEPLIVVADATQIHQIMMNLATNAAHAMESKGGGVLRVELKAYNLSASQPSDPESVSSRLAPGDYVCLSVADTGHGIPAHLMERIFDPYFTTKAKDVGTGLGLAVVRGIVLNHAGAIDVHSQPDKGTTFYIWLPRVEKTVTTEFKRLQVIGAGSERIMLVDDDAVLAELGAKLLSTLGYRVAFFTDPRKAIKTFKAGPNDFDVVITDMIMPNINGKVLARGLFQLRPDVPVIIYTGFSDIIDTDALKDLGIKKVLRKPITIYGLSQAVRQVLEQRDFT